MRGILRGFLRPPLLLTATLSWEYRPMIRDTTIVDVDRPGLQYVIKWDESNSNTYDTLADLQAFVADVPASLDLTGLLRWFILGIWIALDPDASDASLIVGRTLRYNLADNDSPLQFI